MAPHFREQRIMMEADTCKAMHALIARYSDSLAAMRADDDRLALHHKSISDLTRNRCRARGR